MFVTDAHVHLYADDTVIYCNVSTVTKADFYRSPHLNAESSFPPDLSVKSFFCLVSLNLS